MPDLEDYRALVEQSPALICRTGSDARGIYFNAAWLAFTGRESHEELHEGWLEGVHPDDAETFLETYRYHFERAERVDRQFRLRRADGEYRVVGYQAAPLCDGDGVVESFIGHCVVIQDSFGHQASSPIDELFEMSLDNVCVAGFDGYFKRINPSWMRTLGWSREELMSRPIIDFVHPDDRDDVLEDRARLRASETLGAIVNRYLCKDGSYRWFEWRSVANVERRLVYAVARDITEHREASERLREAQQTQERLLRQLVFADRMASVGTLAAGVAHEINNPLAYVSANIAMMLEELEAPELRSPSDQLSAAQLTNLREMAGEAQAGAERIRKIVRGLKTFSRAEEERRTVIDVLPLLEMSINMTFNEIRHKARLVKDFGDIPPVEADDARLGQVFINLLVNAAQALPDGHSETNEIRIVTHTEHSGNAIIEVRDTGPGIPEELLERVFDPFFTTKPVGIGTGLGLSICHNIVHSLGGELTVSSALGVGTTFRIALPRAAPVASEELAADADQQPQVMCASVLVVDDEAAIGLVLRRTLRDHEVTAVTTAREGLELLESGKRFHIIFSDLMMPGMSGMEFFEQIQQRFPSTAPNVVFISGGAFTPGAHDFLDRVTNERLEKPFSPKAVRELVQRYAGG